MMARVFQVVISVIFVAWTKIKYRKRFSGSLLPLFEKVHIRISENGSLFLGTHNQNRGTMYIICQGGKIKLGSYCFFNVNASITSLGCIEIGNKCTFGNNLVIVDYDHDYRRKSGSFEVGAIHIGDNT